MKEYDIYVPLNHNDGSPVNNSMAFFPQANQGLWRLGGVVYRDEIVLYRVVTEEAHAARRFFRVLKEELKRAFRQEDIFLIERDVRRL